MSWIDIRGIVAKEVDKAIEETVSITVERTIEAILPPIVERMIGEILRKDPNHRLSKVGFGWALSMALREHWPGLDNVTAAQTLWEYIDVPYGDPSFVWTFSGAQELAREYVEEFGEVA